MDNLRFSLNATIPLFICMIFGMFFKKIGLFDDNMVKKLNSFVFKAALPVMLFEDLAAEDFYEVWNTKFVLFCFFATLISIALCILISLFFKGRGQRGEFVQAAYRSSAAIMGAALIENIYGNSGMGPLMIIGSVPLYNVMAVVVLSFTGEGTESHKMDRKLILNTLKGIITNPIIIGIIIGLLWSLIKIPQPAIMEKSLNYIGVLATPLGLMSMGASFEFGKALKNLRPVIVAAVLKLVGLAAIFLPIAVALGFRESYLVAILIMLGSPTTVSCYIMAKNMGHEGSLTATSVMLTTLCSAFTLTAWLYILRSMG
ncbi:MAG: AEC family transporter, partial [Clostridiales bacterium]|nr:AEC family transporter [Clostridiales bacterium]